MEFHTNLLSLAAITFALVVALLVSRIFYMQRLHPLAKFPGPWYATSFSIVGAIIYVKQKEPQFFLSLTRKYEVSHQTWDLSSATLLRLRSKLIS